MTWTSSYNNVSVFDESEQTKIQTRLAWITPHTTKYYAIVASLVYRSIMYCTYIK